MASQVLSGSGNVSYTNNTGQNVRIVINYMRSTTSISWGGVSTTFGTLTIGRNLAFTTSDARGIAYHGNNAISDAAGAYPTEIMLASGQTFSAVCGAHNIVVIPEAG